MDPYADDLVRARVRRAFDDVAVRAAATAPGLGAGHRRTRSSLAPLGAAVALAAATGLVGAVLVHRGGPSHTHGTTAAPATTATPRPTPSPTPAALVPRVSGEAVSADLHGGVLVFGGEAMRGGNLLDPQSVLVNETWRWDGHWTQLHPLDAPSPRTGALMVADPAHGQVLLFGGEEPDLSSGNPSLELSDTWTWDGTTWTPRHPRHHPDYAGFDTPATYDAGTGQVMLLVDNSNVWTWNGSDWVEHLTAKGPNVAGAAMMAWDPATRSVILADLDLPPEAPHAGPCCDTGGNLPTVERTWAWKGEAWVLFHPGQQAGLRTNYGVAAYLAADPSGGLLAVFPQGGKAGPAAPTLRHWDGHTWSDVSNADAPWNTDGLVVTSDGRLLSLDLGTSNTGDHPVEEYSGGHWTAAG